MRLVLDLKCMEGPVAVWGRGPTLAPRLRFDVAMRIDHCRMGMRAPSDPMPFRAASHALGRTGIRHSVMVLRSVISRGPRAAG